jgi:hypothetical protein
VVFEEIEHGSHARVYDILVPGEIKNFVDLVHLPEHLPYALRAGDELVLVSLADGFKAA